MFEDKKNLTKEERSKKKLYRRHLFEKFFKLFGVLSISFALIMLVALLFSIFSKGYTAFYTHYLSVEVNFSKEVLFDGDIKDSYTNDEIKNAWFDNLIVEAVKNSLKKNSNLDLDSVDLNSFISTIEVANLRNMLLDNPSLLNQTVQVDLLLSSNIDMFLKSYIGSGSLLNDEEIGAIKFLQKSGAINSRFNTAFFTNSDSRYPELAGVKGAFLGSLYTVVLTIIFSVIISIGAAVYLQEFAPKNRFVRFIEVNINNLAAVPSIVFGLLGLIVFQQFFGVPRSTPLLGSFILTLMALPTIIIASRLAMSSVPFNIKEAAYGMGSSKLQVITHHLLPISMPGILTGVILSISRIIGETAPVLMIGMVAFISTAPTGILSSSVVFPVQILLWSNSPEAGFIEKASAASMLLLIFLMFINWISIYLRNKLEVKF
ncbi:MAG: phosphate ABC transporter permease PstA [Alphaproteobacteria bacterium]|jgi:phosphate transport system permease protein|nr:phosphate ABC transporter permease PstA [Alphaproteobacteria bacterium]